MLRMVPNLRPYAEPLTNAMVEFYLKSQERFTQDMPAPLRLLPQGDDQVGQGHLRGGPPPGQPLHRGTGQALRSRRAEAVPGQAGPRRREGLD